MYIYMRGMPVYGAGEVEWPGGDTVTTHVPSFHDPIRGVSVSPCYLTFKKIDANRCDIVAYGQQRHIPLWQQEQEDSDDR